jgi:transcriptional regulator with XRE-family HTH domain
MGKRTEDLEVAARIRGHLRQQMMERGISRVELARRLGCNAGNLTRILHGQVVPGLGLVVRICRALKVTPTRLLEEDAPPAFNDAHAPVPRRYARKAPT